MLGAGHTLVVDTAVRDVAGNAMSAAFTSAFTTRPGDVTPPRLSSIAPAQNAVDVPVGSFIQVAFTEPIDPSTVSGTSVRVSKDGVTLDGTLTLQNGNRDVRFTPAQPLPFGAVIVTQITSAITDVSGNALVDADGNPLQAPLTFTFMTSTFGITSPARGEDLVENRQVTLQAQGSSSLGIATITFEVNGLALPAVSGPPFTTPFTVPSASSTPTVRIVAIGRNGSNVEVARDELTANVVVGLLTRPTSARRAARRRRQPPRRLVESGLDRSADRADRWRRLDRDAAFVRGAARGTARGECADRRSRHRATRRSR